MALHGPIKVGPLEVGYWSARRVVTGENGINTYACALAWTREDQQSSWRDLPPVRPHANNWHGQIQHDYRDGAIALAAKVLTAATGDHQ